MRESQDKNKLGRLHFMCAFELFLTVYVTVTEMYFSYIMTLFMMKYKFAHKLQLYLQYYLQYCNFLVTLGVSSYNDFVDFDLF